MVRGFLTNPVQSIKKTKKQKNMGKTITDLALVGVITAIAVLIASIRTPLLTGSSLGLTTLISAISVFLLVLIGGLILGWIVQIITTTLGGKGKYYEGLRAIVNTLIAPSIGALIASIFLYVPAVGTAVIFLVLAVTIALGLATLYRSIKELFSTDIITALVTVSVLSMAVVIAIMGATLSFASMFPMLSSVV